MHASRHRANPSVAASVDLDVEGGGRLDEDYDGGWTTTPMAWSAKGPAAYTSSMGIVQSAKCHLAWARAGFADANRWPDAAKVAARSSEIRSGIIKGFILTASIAILIFIFELAFFPSHLFQRRHSSSHHQIDWQEIEDDEYDGNMGSIGNVFWLYPLVAGAYFLAATWTMDVAKAAHQLKHGRSTSHSAQNMLSPGASRKMIIESYRVILVINYALISFALQQIPWIGRGLAFIFMSFIDAYYCFEQTWIARGWSVDRRMRYAESRWAYFVAFGLPSTLISFFHPSGLLNLMLFMLVFPFCTVLALLATPQPRVASTGSTTLTPQNSGLSPSLANNCSLSAALPPRLPIFWITIKLYRLVLRLFPSAIDANMLSAPNMAHGNAWRTAFPDSSFGSQFSAAEDSQAFMIRKNNGSAGYSGTSAGAGYSESLMPMAPNVVDKGTSSTLAGKRGAMAAQFVDGAWGGQGIAAGTGVLQDGQGAHTRSNAGASPGPGSGGSPSLLGANNGSRFGSPSPAPSLGRGTYASHGQAPLAGAFKGSMRAPNGGPAKKRD